MRYLSLCLLALFASACSFAAPLEPSPPAKPMPVIGTPATLDLGLSPGIGDQGGTATINIRVLDAYGAPVAQLGVMLTSTDGMITPSLIGTDSGGRGTARLQAAPGFVTVTASTTTGTLSRTAVVAIQPVPQAPPTPTPAPPPTPVPELPVPPLTVTLLVNARQAGFATGFSLATQAITSATWDFGDGGIMTTPEPFTSHVYSVAGTYTASVKVTDARGRMASASTTVTIAAAPK
jgi:hypothetical protein